VALASVVIPAHNEERVVGRALRSLTLRAEPDELEIVVVCNGCSDRTAEVARAVCPGATVLEIDTASKIAALNEGDSRASTFPRFYVDADVEVGVDAIRATAGVLSSGTVLCAAPAPVFDTTERRWSIRRFYDVWQQLPYLSGPVVGNGVYALSRAGRARFGQFPDVIADDQFVLLQFAETERAAVRSATFTVHTPRDLRGLVRIRTRAYRGNLELAHMGLASAAGSEGSSRGVARLARRPRTLPAVATYLAVNLVAKTRARGRASGWERDDSSRRTAG